MGAGGLVGVFGLPTVGRGCILPPDLMRSLCSLICAGLGLALCSCETIDSQTAGGGAFDDSYLSQRLDSNNPNLEENQNEKGKTAPPSYNQWRHD